MTASYRSIVLCSIMVFVATVTFCQIPTGYVEQDQGLPCLDKTFSLRVHINNDEGGQIPFVLADFQRMLDRTNEAFAPICVSFEVCEYLRIENYRYLSQENNDITELVNIYGDPNRIDVFIPKLDSIPTVCGDATFNGITTNETAYVMVVNRCIEETSAVLTRELGRYFGLYNTFETEFGVDFVDGSTCETRGDLICDTPADPYVIGSPIQWTDPENPCLFVFPGQDSAGRFYTPHVANAMSYYSGECGCGFTRGQLEVMAQNCVAAGNGIW